jgi:mono/diheme cytochrome c family protein
MKITLTILLLLSVTIKISAQSNWKAPKSAATIENPFKGNKNAIKNGKKLFASMCVICHGIKGKGDGMAGAALKPKPANFTSLTVQGQTDGEIFWKMTNGNPPMAGYKEILTEAQRWELVNYLRTFKK